MALTEYAVSKSVETLKAHYQMQPHPEGGCYAELYRSTTNVDAGLLENQRLSAYTHILYMLVGRDYSAWHRIKSDEIWHWHMGGEMRLHILQPDQTLETVLLGNPLSNEKTNLTYCVPAGLWFAAELVDVNQYAMVGCTVAPGFEFQYFELANQEQLQEYAAKANAEEAMVIQRLLRK